MSNKPEIKFIKRNRKEEELKNKLKEVERDLAFTRIDFWGNSIVLFTLIVLTFIFLLYDFNVNAFPNNFKFQSIYSAGVDKVMVPVCLLIIPFVVQKRADIIRDLIILKEKRSNLKNIKNNRLLNIIFYIELILIIVASIFLLIKLYYLSN